MMKKTVSFFILFFLSLILVLNAGCNGLPQTNLPDIPSEPEEFYQSSVHSDSENRFYFVDGTLFKQNRNTKVKTAIFQLKSDQVIDDFYFTGSYVYFVLRSQDNQDDSFSICRIDENGKNFSVLLDDSFLMPEDDWEGKFVHALAAAEDHLVIQMTFSLYVHDMTTGQTVKISPDAQQMEVSGGKLYYLSEFSVVERNVKSEQEKVILQSAYNDMDREQSNHLCSSFIFINGVMFYCQRLPYGLYRYVNGISNAVYEGKGIDEYCLTQYGENLYFVVTDATQSGLYRYDPKKDALALIQYLPNYKFNGGDKILDGVFYYHNHMGWVETIPLSSD